MRNATSSWRSGSCAETRRVSVRERSAPVPASARVLFAGYAIVAAVSALLAYGGAFDRADRALIDAQFALLRRIDARPAAHDVVLVGIDDDTVRSIAEPIALWHRHLGRFLQATATGEAAAVGLDVVLPDRSFEALAPGIDRQLVAGILAARRAAPLVLAKTIDPEGRQRAVHPVFIAAAGPQGHAYALLPIDPDGVVRRFHEQLGERGESVPTLAGELARRLGAKSGRGVIDYSLGAAFDYVPLHRVLALHDARDAAGLKKLFAGKPVLLGGVFKFEDHLGAPVNLSAWDPANPTVPGVVLHAQALRNLLDGKLIDGAPKWLPVALCVLLAAVWFVATTPARALLALLAGGAAILAGSTALLASGRYVPAAAPFAALTLGAVARSARESVLGMRERAKLRRAFSGYVSPGVMDDILAGEIAAELGGVNRYVCTLFSDIRGYTTRSEGMTPQQIVAFLNSYFERVVEIIHAHRGTVMTFMGDGIMAVFGAPRPLDNPCEDAYAAARDLLAYVQDFNAKARADGIAPIDIGVGLHAGDVVVGHVGSSSRHDYTAIGDVINVASRLEGVTKDVGYRLVYSDAVAMMLKKSGDDVPLGPREIKGHTPVEAFGHDRVT